MDEAMHPSMARLYQAQGDPTQAELAALFNTSSQRILNLERRGISKDLALDAQSRFGISAVWLLEGSGPERVASHAVTPDHAKLEAAIRFFDDLAQAHPEYVISETARHRIVTDVYLELLSASRPNWVEMTRRYTSKLEAEAA